MAVRNVKVKRSHRGGMFIEGSTGKGPWLFPHLSGAWLHQAIKTARFITCYGAPTAKASVSRRKREGYRPWMKAKATKEVYRRAAEYSRRMTKNGVDFSKRMDAMSPAFAMGYASGWGLEVKNPNSVASLL